MYLRGQLALTCIGLQFVIGGNYGFQVWVVSGALVFFAHLCFVKDTNIPFA